MQFYNTSTEPDMVHANAVNELRRNMMSARKGEFRYRPGRLPRVWENIHRDTEIAALFAYLEAKELVRVEMQPDDLTMDDLFGDAFDEEHASTIPGGLRELKAQEREACRRLGDEGQWYICGEYLAVHTETDMAEATEIWEQGDCIGGFVGSDFEGSGYEPDVYITIIEALFENRGLMLPRYAYSKDATWLRACRAIWEMYEAMHVDAA